MVRRRISIFVSVITIGVTFLALNVPSRGRSEWLADWCASSRVLGVRTCVFFKGDRSLYVYFFNVFKTSRALAFLRGRSIGDIFAMVMMILQTFGHSLLFSYLDYHDLLQKLAVVCAGKKKLFAGNYQAQSQRETQFLVA